MIVSRSLRLCYLHIPKTGGTSVTHALSPACRLYEVWWHDRKHHPWRALRGLLGDVGDWLFLATWRPPAEILASDYEFCRRHAETTDGSPWGDKCRNAARLDWPDWLAEHYGGKREGFASTYLRDENGEFPPNLHLIETSQLLGKWPKAWRRIADHVGDRSAERIGRIGRLNAAQKKGPRLAVPEGFESIVGEPKPVGEWI